jgi:Peptidase family M28
VRGIFRALLVNHSGPALLFRTSNAAVARAYKGTPYPRVSQLGNDFFKSGLIRSETDYIVYEDMNGFTPGLDVAFFKPRSLYHTSADDLRHARRGSLQHMLSTGLTTVRNLADNIAVENFNHGGQPVYFDFLAGNLAQVNMGVMWIWNLLLLVLCPWILALAFLYRVRKYGKVTLHGKGATSSALFGGAVVVLGSMALFSIHSAAVYRSLQSLTAVGLCACHPGLGIYFVPHFYRILRHYTTYLRPAPVD